MYCNNDINSGAPSKGTGALQFGMPVYEMDTDHKLWAIRRCLPHESPRCSAMVFRNGRWETCGRNIKPDVDSSYAAPCFYGCSEFRYKKSFQNFWFCATSARECVSSDHVQLLKGGKPPPLPTIWPVESGTKLTTAKADSLGTAGFTLVHKAASPDGIAGSSRRCPDDNRRATRQTPKESTKRPLLRNGRRVIRRSMKEVGEARRKEGLLMRTQVQLIEQDDGNCTYRFSLHTVSRTLNKLVTYTISISEFPSCTCDYFVGSISDTKAGHFFSTCEHMYHIYNVYLGLPLTDDRPHQATLSKSEVEDIITTWRTTRS